MNHKGTKITKEKGADPKSLKDTKIESDRLSHEIISAAIEVHRQLGPGLLESAYEQALCHELTLKGIRFERQKHLPVVYKGVNLDAGYRIDILVEDLVIVELKAAVRMEPLFEAQILTYLKLSNLWLGLLLNFNVHVMKQGIKRVVN